MKTQAYKFVFNQEELEAIIASMRLFYKEGPCSDSVTFIQIANLCDAYANTLLESNRSYATAILTMDDTDAIQEAGLFVLNNADVFDVPQRDRAILQTVISWIRIMTD